MDSQVELELLRAQVSDLNKKFDEMSKSIQNIEKILAKQDGQNLALRVYSVEQEVATLKTKEAANSWVPETVNDNAIKIGELNKFMYKILGIGIVASAVITTIGVAVSKVIVERLF